MFGSQHLKDYLVIHNDLLHVNFQLQRKKQMECIQFLDHGNAINNMSLVNGNWNIWTLFTPTEWQIHFLILYYWQSCNLQEACAAHVQTVPNISSLPEEQFRTIPSMTIYQDNFTGTVSHVYFTKQCWEFDFLKFVNPLCKRNIFF